MKMGHRVLGWMTLLLMSAGAPMAAAAEAAGDKACTQCHAQYAKKKYMHGALEKGCAKCHGDIDGSRTPHVPTGRLILKQTSDQVRLCTSCHDRALSEGKVVHAPVATGNCLGCHDVHASDHVGLLVKEPVALCLDCHPEVRQGPHVIAGFSRTGHPLGELRSGQRPIDPLRPGREFYCVSCHEPHRSQAPHLNRFGPSTGSCVQCHKM